MSAGRGLKSVSGIWRSRERARPIASDGGARQSATALEYRAESCLRYWAVVLRV